MKYGKKSRFYYIAEILTYREVPNRLISNIIKSRLILRNWVEKSQSDLQKMGEQTS